MYVRYKHGFVHVFIIYIINYIEMIRINKILILYKSKYTVTKKYAYMLKECLINMIYISNIG